MYIIADLDTLFDCLSHLLNVLHATSTPPVSPLTRSYVSMLFAVSELLLPSIGDLLSLLFRIAFRPWKPYVSASTAVSRILYPLDSTAARQRLLQLIQLSAPSTSGNGFTNDLCLLWQHLSVLGQSDDVPACSRDTILRSLDAVSRSVYTFLHSLFILISPSILHWQSQDQTNDLQQLPADKQLQNPLSDDVASNGQPAFVVSMIQTTISVAARAVTMDSKCRLSLPLLILYDASDMCELHQFDLNINNNHETRSLSASFSLTAGLQQYLTGVLKQCSTEIQHHCPAVHLICRIIAQYCQSIEPSSADASSIASIECWFTILTQILDALDLQLLSSSAAAGASAQSDTIVSSVKIIAAVETALFEIVCCQLRLQSLQSQSSPLDSQLAQVWHRQRERLVKLSSSAATSDAELCPLLETVVRMLRRCKSNSVHSVRYKSTVFYHLFLFFC